MTTADLDVLVVEDETDSMELVQELLGYHGIRSVGADSGEQAIALLNDYTPTLIIIDLALPGIDGWNLLRQIKSQERLMNVPCVAVTAYHSAELADKALTAGFSAYFSKPVDATSFVRELESIIAT